MTSAAQRLTGLRDVARKLGAIETAAKGRNRFALRLGEGCDLSQRGVQAWGAASALVRALDLDLELAGDIDLEVDLAAVRNAALDLAGNLSSAVERERERDRELADIRALGNAIIRQSARDLARRGIQGLVRVDASDLDRARELRYQHARDRARDLDLARTLASDLDRRLDSAAEAVLLARQQVAMMIGEAEEAQGARQADTPAPARAATRLVICAVRLLPMAQRARYREEYTAELADMAAQRMLRWQQLVYGLHVAGGVWSLRRALRAPRPADGRRR